MKRRAAFTLVEMIVALAVTGVLTVMMLQMLSDSSRIWKAEDDRLDTFREARAALQLMSRELATTLPMPQATGKNMQDHYPVLALRDPQTRDVAGLSRQYFTSAFLLTGVPNDGRGDLCAVGYFLEWEPAIGSANPATATAAPRSAFVLRRQAAQSDTTFARLRETLRLPANGQDAFFGEKTFAALYSMKTSSAPAGGSPLPAPTVETIASYVWDLQFSVASEPAIPTATPAPEATPAPGKNGFYGTKLPSWVEIRFKALGSTAARKLAGNPRVTEELWTKPDAPDYTRLILPAEQQFVSRVKLAR